MKDTASTPDDAKSYISERQIPQLFESLMTGLMYNRPIDHLGYMMQCLEKAQEEGASTVKWNSFVEMNKKDPLPPIVSRSGSALEEIVGGTTDRSTGDEVPTEMKKSSPLPPIGYTDTPRASPEATTTSPGLKDEEEPDIKEKKTPVVLVMGGPGSNKVSRSRAIVEKYKEKNWAHISPSKLLREMCNVKPELKDAQSALETGSLVDDDLVVNVMEEAVEACKDAGALLVDGFPRTAAQAEKCQELFPHIDLAILLDCDENIVSGKVYGQDGDIELFNTKLREYKEKTMPIINQFDTQGKLVILSGDNTNEKILNDMSDVIDVAFYNKEPGYLITSGRQSFASTKDEEVSTQPTADVGEESTPDSTDKEDTPANSAADLKTTEQPADTQEQVPVQEEEIAAEVALTTGNTEPEIQTKQEVAEEVIKPEESPTTEEQASEKTEEDREQLDMAELKNKKVIFVVGGPGCGKGTQCAKIVEKYGFCHLSSGDLLREEVASGSARGKELNAIMESGALVSLDVVLTLLKEAMMKNSSANGFLIDGYPRELEQGTRFEAEIVSPACVLYFSVPDDVMVERLLGRAKTSGRVDDNEETIKKRLKTFHDHCDNVLSHYKTKNLLCQIDARGAVDGIFEEVVKSIDASK